VVLRFLRRLDIHNPLAGLVLRWLFKPDRVQFKYPRAPHEFGEDWTIQDWFESGYAWIDEDDLGELENLIKAEMEGKSYPGPLTLHEGPFTFETPWIETPELFRFLFRWLVSDYEINDRLMVSPQDPFSVSESSRFRISGPVHQHLDWVFLQPRANDPDRTAVQRLTRLRLFLESHDLYAVPRFVSRRWTKQSVMKDFECFLDEIVDREKKTIATNKLPHLLGSEKAWDVFTFCYPRISYEYRSAGPGFDKSFPFSRSGSGTSFERLVAEGQREGKWALSSDMSSHVQQHYERLESLMRATFPRFDFARMLRIEDPELSNDAVLVTSESALSASRYKLDCLR
jgi:hypothetical protein